jgi:outer membrane protein OmpA-like peptidoglycan-associated protein
MAGEYSWSASRDTGAYRLPGPDHLGWWAAVAMLLSILLHVVAFFALDQLKIVFDFQTPQEIGTRPVDIRQVEIRPLDNEQSLPPEEVVQPPADTAALLDEIELLDILPKDIEIDIKPDVIQAEYALQMQNPALEGDPEAAALEISTGLEVDAEVAELGREPVNLQPAELGQITVDPGSVQVDDSEIGKFTEDLIRKGANGKAENGTLDGVTSLDNLLDLPPNILLSKKTLLPSDLLFEFNSADLRESAKIGLMKLGLLMDKNPELYCWIEGHADLVGGDEFNLNLSIQRAEAVKKYLVDSLRMDASKIVTRGFGRYEPIVTSGTPEEQAANRRVEIRMRQGLPTKDQMKVVPQKAAVVVENPPPKPVLVKPQRALPVEEEIPPPPRAAPVAETPPLRAMPVFPEIPKASAVTEEEIPLEVPRAQTVEDED